MEASFEVSGEAKAQLLKSLTPSNEKEVSYLRAAVQFARKMQDGFPGATDVAAFVRGIPGDCVNYFHGLVEALEIYRSIYGEVPNLEPGTAALEELRVIREHCLDPNLRGLY